MSKESDEKRELLKLKQGIISESEVIEQDVHEQPEKQTVAKKIDNFFFRNKWFVAVGAFFAAVGFFLVYQAVTREQPDLTVILAVSDTSKPIKKNGVITATLIILFIASPVPFPTNICP